jgi:hypothetical protein
VRPKFIAGALSYADRSVVVSGLPFIIGFPISQWPPLRQLPPISEETFNDLSSGVAIIHILTVTWFTEIDGLEIPKLGGEATEGGSEPRSWSSLLRFILEYLFGPINTHDFFFLKPWAPGNHHSSRFCSKAGAQFTLFHAVTMMLT